MSQLNGDKSRFNRLRKQKALRRKRNRELRKALGLLKTPGANADRRVGLRGTTPPVASLQVL